MFPVCTKIAWLRIVGNQEPFCAQFGELAAGMMQHLVVVDHDRGDRGEPSQGIAGAEDAAPADRLPGIAQAVERHRDADPGRIVGTQDGTRGCYIADHQPETGGQ